MRNAPPLEIRRGHENINGSHLCVKNDGNISSLRWLIITVALCRTTANSRPMPSRRHNGMLRAETCIVAGKKNNHLRAGPKPCSVWNSVNRDATVSMSNGMVTKYVYCPRFCLYKFLYEYFLLILLCILFFKIIIPWILQNAPTFNFVMKFLAVNFIQNTKRSFYFLIWELCVFACVLYARVFEGASRELCFDIRLSLISL